MSVIVNGSVAGGSTSLTSTEITNITQTPKLIFNADKIKKGLASFSKASSDRVTWVWHGHSVITGYGSDDTEASAAANVTAWANRCIPAIVGKRLNSMIGGAWCRGADTFVTYHSGLFTLGGGSTIEGPFTSNGPGGYRVRLQSATQTITFTTIGTAIQMKCVADAAGRQLRYAVNGGAITAATAAPTDATPLGSGHWYTVTLTGLTAGDSVQLLGPTAGSVSVYSVDLDYKSSAGLTIHRMSIAGLMGAQVLSSYMADADTQPAGAWAGAPASTIRLTQHQSITNRFTPSLILNTFDINDLKAYAPWGWSLATLKTHLSNYLTRCNTDGYPVLLVAGPIRDPALTIADAVPYSQADLIEAYKDVVSSATAAGFLDLTDEYTQSTLAARYAAQVADGVTVDSVHPNTIGSAYFGNRIAQAISSSIGGP